MSYRAVGRGFNVNQLVVVVLVVIRVQALVSMTLAGLMDYGCQTPLPKGFSRTRAAGGGLPFPSPVVSQ